MSEQKCRKVYVPVNLDVDAEGNIRPRLIRWLDGRVYEIDRLKHKCRAAATKVGGCGIRYTVMIGGHESCLLYTSVRVLLGSTQKMGAGTNVQDRLVAVHHLDVGWRPADMTQRNGRIIRQGNRNKEVQIYQYVTCLLYTSTGRYRNRRRWTASLLAKLAEMTDAEYEALDLYPDE